MLEVVDEVAEVLDGHSHCDELEHVRRAQRAVARRDNVGRLEVAVRSDEPDRRRSSLSVNASLYPSAGEEEVARADMSVRMKHERVRLARG